MCILTTGVARKSDESPKIKIKYRLLFLLTKRENIDLFLLTKRNFPWHENAPTSCSRHIHRTPIRGHTEPRHVHARHTHVHCAVGDAAHPHNVQCAEMSVCALLAAPVSVKQLFPTHRHRCASCNVMLRSFPALSSPHTVHTSVGACPAVMCGVMCDVMWTDAVCVCVLPPPPPAPLPSPLRPLLPVSRSLF